MTTLQQAHRTTLMLLQSPNRSLLAPDAIIDFGPNNVLGTIKLHGSPAYPVAAFLQKVNGQYVPRFLGPFTKPFTRHSFLLRVALERAFFTLRRVNGIRGGMSIY